MAHISGAAVAIVRQDVEHDGGARRPVAFVGQFLIVASLGSAETLLYGALDVVLGNVVRLRLGKRELQPHISRRIAAAHAHGNGDLPADLRRDLAANRIIRALFPLDVRPFGMS